MQKQKKKKMPFESEQQNKWRQYTATSFGVTSLKFRLLFVCGKFKACATAQELCRHLLGSTGGTMCIDKKNPC